MFSPSSPTSSPLAHLSSKPAGGLLFHPTISSPLSGSSSPTRAVQRRKRQYKSQASSRSTAVPNIFGPLQDTPQKQFLRDKFMARCHERAKENKERALRKARASSSGDGSSSDGFDMDGDFAMDDEAEDPLDDELFNRIMIMDQKKVQHAKRVSFEHDFGSSIDPDMYEDMETLEWEFTGRMSKPRSPSPPSEGELDDAQIQEYLAELEEFQSKRAQEQAANTSTDVLDSEDPGDLEREFTSGVEQQQQPSPTRSMFSDFQMSSPPSSPSRYIASASTRATPSSTWSCPFCSTPTARTHIACSSCITQYPLEHAVISWADAESHPGAQQSDHVPLATTMPSVGVMMICSAPDCDWCFAL